MIEELKGNNTVYFDVYKTTTGLYIERELCNNFNIGSEEKIIKNIPCLKVSEEDINKIEKQTINNTTYKSNYVTIFDLQLVLSFNVYVDTNHENKLYITDTLCDKYKITPISKRIVNKLTYSHVTEEDLNKIEKLSEQEKLILKRKYVGIKLEDKTKAADYLFMYYLDVDDKKMYINRETLEKARKNNVEIEAIPKIIEDKNCYSITKEELKNLEEKTSTHGIERLVSKNNRNNNTVTKKDNCKTIIIYRDVITDKLYIKEEDIFSNRYSNEKCILNNLCKEISVRELENTYNKKFIIADVYTYNKCKEYNILVCNADDKLFISNNILLNFNIYLDDARKIIINKEIYTQVNDNIIDYLNSLNSESIKINIVNKKIIPVNKEQ